MGQDTEKRRQLIGRMSGHLLEHGLAGSGLRALARSAGTSDRMLLYYFADKDELLAAVFRHLGEQLQARLAADVPVNRVDADRLLETLWAQSQDREVQRHSTLLVEMAAAAVRHGEPYSHAAQVIAAHFQDWIAAHLDLDSDAERRRAAYRIMATLDGMALLRALGIDPP